MQSSLQEHRSLAGTPISRNPSPPAFRHLHAAGEFTPEISPLDEFINRGRLLSKQLGTGSRTGSPTLTPLTVHASLRRTGRSPSPLSRSRTVGRDSTSSSSVWLTVTPGDSTRVPAPVPLEDRPTSSYPRFSMVSSTSTEDDRASERDSLMSGVTSIRDSNFTLMGGFLNPDRNPPNLQQLGAKGMEHGGYDGGRVSLKPVIVGSESFEAVGVQEEEKYTGASPSGQYIEGRVVESTQVPYHEPQGPHNGRQGPYHEPMDSNRGRDRRRDIPQGQGPSNNAAAYVRSKSQPPRSDRRPPPRHISDVGDGRQLQHPVPQNSERQVPPMTYQYSDRQLPLRQGSAPQYQPYRQDSASSGATSIGPLSRQGSTENETFPPQRKGSLGPMVPLARQGSAEAEMFPHLHRQGSGSSDRLHPHRQDSRGSEHRMYPGRQNSGESGVKYQPYRAGVPAPLGLNGEGGYRRPSQSGDLYERRRPSRQDSLESDHGRHRGRSHEPQFHPGPQRSPTHSPAPMILPMVAGMRTISPESASVSPIDGDSRLAFGPPTPSYVHEYHPRPGSAASQTPSIYSLGGTPKPMFNFSRPLSNRPSMDTLTMNPGLEIPQRLSPEHSPMFPDEYSIPTPVSISEEYEENEDPPAPTVVYSRFALPRGRELDRNSVVFQESGRGQPRQPITSHQRPGPSRVPADTSYVRPPSPNSPPAPLLQPVPTRDRAATYSRSPSSSRPQLLSPTSRPHTSASPSPRSPVHIPPTAPTSAIMSADDHVQKGINLHESGALQESTYHLRLAANGGHPTGMLLYALACRHGWGMKANPKEGVMWLKKVTELASSEVADDEMKGGKADFFEKKGRRAQFALSIYELGVSHMNGWGTEMDKGLALRCFEIAGRWGDPDALAETGFCYANGVGCKKNMMKSAKFYRAAEAKGMSMPGNSWIWKDKYLDDEDRAAKKSKAKNEGEKAGKKKK